MTEQTVAKAADETAKKKRPQDPELVAMNKIRSVLEGLSADARCRVLSYVRSRVESEALAAMSNKMAAGVAVERAGLRGAEPASSF